MLPLTGERLIISIEILIHSVKKYSTLGGNGDFYTAISSERESIRQTLDDAVSTTEVKSIHIRLVQWVIDVDITNDAIVKALEKVLRNVTC